LENVADALAASGLASREELSELVAELYRIGADDRTIMSGPRIVQAWGHKPTQA
jgi:hypothetical protein